MTKYLADYRMDNFRLVFGVMFAVSLFLIFEAWTRYNKPPTTITAAAPQGSVSAPNSVPQSTSVTPSAAPPATAPKESGERITVRTDTMVAEISALGGDIRRVELLKHREPTEDSKEFFGFFGSSKAPAQNFVLLRDDARGVYVAQTGILGDGQANHTTKFDSAKSEYSLSEGEKELRVVLSARSEAGVETTKILRFTRGSYLVQVEYEVRTPAGAKTPVDAYFQLLRDRNPAPGESKMMPTYTGGEIYTEATKLIKLPFDDVEDKKHTLPKGVQEGWIAFVQHYFLGAWLPEKGVQREFYARSVDSNHFAYGTIVPLKHEGPVSSAKMGLYLGPQDQDVLKALAPGLEFTVDYGILRVLAVPLFWVLDKIYGFVGNWGVAIIILTILIKLAFYPLSAASYKSMAKMKVLAPKLQRLKERYGEDRQKLHQSMMELYKTEKVNPLGGCLPILVQIPVFIALYWVLLLSVELRQAPFAWWIQDLSSKDPIAVLPILMAITMFVQTALNPTPPDPMQARLMKIMPIAFSVFFFFFPAGLVLYWLVNNILSIAQQWHINRTMGANSPNGKS